MQSRKAQEVLSENSVADITDLQESSYKEEPQSSSQSQESNYEESCSKASKKAKSKEEREASLVLKDITNGFTLTYNLVRHHAELDKAPLKNMDIKWIKNTIRANRQKESR